MARRIQLAILSDSRLFRDALSSRLAGEDEVAVVGAAGTIYDLLMRARGRPIDVLLAYLGIRSELAMEIVWDIKTLMPATRVVVLGCEGRKADTVGWIEAGAMAWLGHNTAYKSLVDAILAVSEGRTYCPTEVVTDVALRVAQLQRADPDLKWLRQETLSDREGEVSQLLRLGLSNKEIARELGLRGPTVKSHVSEVLRKLGMARRHELDLRRSRRLNVYGDGSM